MSRWLPTLIFLTELLALCIPGWAASQTCRSITMTAEALSAWHNPHPSPDDFTLPMPVGLSLVFVPVPLGTTGLYGDERTTFTMGAAQSKIYETPLEARVGSSITDRSGQTRLLIGKYEVTLAQYAAVMGRGDLPEGLRVLRQRSKATRVHRELDRYLEKGSPCQGKITDRLHRMLSEPLTFLSFRDYVEFLDSYNLFCISRNDCRRILRSLGPNRDVPGFVRLPREHEWEFVARGGGHLVSGRLSKSDIQRDLPTLRAGGSISDYAHIGNDPPNALPIGSRQPLFGFFDLYGNAQELMGNAFTAENGFGAVGAYVARGGHFGLNHTELRASRRVELTAFRTDDATGQLDIQYFPRTGIRLAVGLPVAGAALRLGDNSLIDDFVENYVAPEQAGDSAGDRLSEARILGNLGDRKLEVNEELGGDDSEDWYAVQLQDYGRIQVELEGEPELAFEIVNMRQETLGQGSGQAGRIETGELLPGGYWLRVHSGSRRLSSEVRYRVTLGRSLAPDSGIDRPHPSALQNAMVIGETFTGPIMGFVGKGDTIDTYPIINRSRIPGLEVELLTDSGLVISLLDEQLRLLQRETFAPADGEGKVVLATRPGQRGFLQIEADPPAQSVYEARIRAKAPFDPVFLTEKPRSVAAVKSFARSGQTYEGTISGSQVLYLPIQLEHTRSLKVELSGLEADIAMSVIDGSQRLVRSNHGRPGSQAEFFSKTLQTGNYLVSLRMTDNAEKSAFKLVYRADAPESSGSSIDDILRQEVRREAKNFGQLGPNIKTSSVTALTPYQYLRFTIVGHSEKIVSLSVSGGWFSRADFDIYLEDILGRVLARSANRAAGIENITISLDQGTYYLLVIERGGRGFSSFEIEAVAMDEMLDPDLSWAGQLVGRHGSFGVYRNDQYCTLVTVAHSASPVRGWRPVKPMMVVRVSPGGRRIVISMDLLARMGSIELYRSGSLRGFVDRQTEIDLRMDDGTVYPTVKCSRGFGWCVPEGLILNMVSGRNLTIEGITPSGQPAEVTYSLEGYEAAARSITQLCGVDADWIWNE